VLGKIQQSDLLLEDETLRDGLQIESQLFTIDQKVDIFNLLKEAGVRRIQVGSLVHPKIVPQMADTYELIQRLGKQTDTVISALILNGRGLDRALACNVPHVSMSVSISDSHSRKNASRSAAEALASMVELIKNARSQGLLVRAGLQSAFGCVYEGHISEQAVLAAAEQMAEAGVNEINLADSSGMANPKSVRSLVELVAGKLPELGLSLHFHDTRGMGLANMCSGYEAGVRIFDVCAGGLGGCPFVKGAAGNVPSEDAVNMFESMEIDTGIDLEKMIKVTSYLEDILKRSLPGRMKRVLSFQKSNSVEG
jgi:hydroxymethylglutaryl-CoA lyase